MSEENTEPDSSPALETVDDGGNAEKNIASTLSSLENIDVSLSVEVGSTQLKIKDLLTLNEGSVLVLDRLAGDPLDIKANGTLIARGEVVMVGERFGIRFSSIVDPSERVKGL